MFSYITPLDDTPVGFNSPTFVITESNSLSKEVVAAFQSLRFGSTLEELKRKSSLIRAKKARKRAVAAAAVPVYHSGSSYGIGEETNRMKLVRKATARAVRAYALKAQ
jgi:hypothetical protein